MHGLHILKNSSLKDGARLTRCEIVLLFTTAMFALCDKS